MSRLHRGYARETGPDGFRKEVDTFTCGHCQRVIFVKPGPSSGGIDMCRVCMRMICGHCFAALSAPGGRCDPFEKKLERSEARGRFLRSLGGT